MAFEMGEATWIFLPCRTGDYRQKRYCASVLEPARIKRLRGVCELIATQAVIRDVTKVTTFGRVCKTAGAFFAIRGLLHDSGVDVSDIRPSTVLAPYLRRTPITFVIQLAKLAPGVLPLISIQDHPAYNYFLLAEVISFVVCLVSIPVAWCIGSFVPFVASIMGFIACHIGLRIAANRQPQKVSFEGLQTFGDLSRVIAKLPSACIIAEARRI